MLSLAVEALQHDHDFAAATRWRFRHLLVDEAQDLNPVQHRLVDLLRHDQDDLFLVGDPAQAIFAFNGTDPSLLVDVSDRFPGIEIVRLPTNHRCTPQIVEAGAHVLTTGGQPTTVRSGRPDGRAVRVVDCIDEEHESATVARLIRHLDPGLVGTGGVGVLARTNAQLERDPDDGGERRRSRTAADRRRRLAVSRCGGCGLTAGICRASAVVGP